MDEVEVLEKKKSALEMLEEAKRGKMLKEIDHSKIEYNPFRKNLYIVPKALSRLTELEAQEKRCLSHICIHTYINQSCLLFAERTCTSKFEVEVAPHQSTHGYVRS